MPRIGSRKLYILVKREFGSQQGFPGRDKFLDLLSDQGLLLRIKRRKHYKTTDSNHPFKRYPNLIRDKVFRAPNQAWASDITYVETALPFVNYRSLFQENCWLVSRRNTTNCSLPKSLRNGPGNTTISGRLKRLDSSLGSRVSVL